MSSKPIQPSEILVAYEGERPVCVGTIRDLMRFWGVKRSTVKWYSYPSVVKRENRYVIRPELIES